MISCISCENMHLYGQAMISQYRLRYKSFIQRQSYKVFSYNSMEYDEYDNPSAVYLVYQSPENEALGVSRLTPVCHRSMLKDLYPEMVLDHSLFQSKDVWEGTRFCVEKDLDPALRDRIVKELVSAYFEFGLQRDIKKIIGMMPSYILERVFLRNGCEYEKIGPVKIIDGQRIQAASMDISVQKYKKFLQISNLTRGALSDNGYLLQEAA